MVSGKALISHNGLLKIFRIQQKGDFSPILKEEKPNEFKKQGKHKPTGIFSGCDSGHGGNSGCQCFGPIGRSHSCGCPRIKDPQAREGYGR
jgi:hypothetical protein